MGKCKKYSLIMPWLMALLILTYNHNASAAITNIQNSGSSSFDMTVGNTQQISYTTTDDGTTSSYITWATDNSSVASVNSSGLITANAEGTAHITASADSAAYSWTVYVDGESSAYITDENPENGDDDVAVSKTIKFEFSKAMRSSTITEDNIYLRKSGSSTNIDADVSYDSDTYTVTIEPDSDLAYDTKYYVYVTSSVDDYDGNSISSAQWYFTTASDDDSSSSSFISSKSPGDGDTNIPVNRKVRIYFKNAMKESTITEDNIYLKKSGSSSSVPATVSYSSDDYSATVTPDDLLQSGTDYTVYLTDSVRESNGDYIDAVHWSFTTEGSTSSANATNAATVAAAAPVQNTTENATRIGSVNNPLVKINGEYVNFTGVSPYIKNGRTMLPFRTLFELLGANVTWDAQTKKVTGTLNNKSIILQIGNKVAYEDGTALNMDVAPEISSGETMIPLRFAAEGLNVTVGWDASSYTVMLNK